MTVGNKLLLAILKNKDIDALFKTKDSHLIESVEKISFNFVKKYYAEFGELPTMAIVGDKYSIDVTELDSLGTTEYYEKSLLERYVYVELADKLPKLVHGLKANPMDRLSELMNIVSELDIQSSKSSDKVFYKEALSRLGIYDEKVRTEGITYISTGNDVLDDATFGIGKTDLWTFGGRSGTKKTWFLCRLAYEIDRALKNDYGPILFISNEINNEEITERMDCIHFKLGYKRFLNGGLTEDEFRRYKKGLYLLEKRKKSRLILVFNCNTLEDLRRKITIYKPAVTLVDGSYMMEPQMEEGIVKTTYITRNLKSICNAEGSPIINTTQLRKKTGKKASSDFLAGQDEFFYGSYVQDSDVAIRGYISPEMVYHNQVGLDFVKGRRMEPNVSLIWKSDLEKMEFYYKLAEKELDDSVVSIKEED